MNLTDVDDKTIRGAQEAGPRLRTSRRSTSASSTGHGRLNEQPAEHPKATEHVPEMIDLIRRLAERGHTYEAEGSVYFRIATFPDYGKLSGIDLSQTRRSDRVADDEVREGGREGLRPVEVGASPENRRGRRRGARGDRAGTSSAPP